MQRCAFSHGLCEIIFPSPGRTVQTKLLTNVHGLPQALAKCVGAPIAQKPLLPRDAFFTPPVCEAIFQEVRQQFIWMLWPPPEWNVRSGILARSIWRLGKRGNEFRLCCRISYPSIGCLGPSDAWLVQHPCDGTKAVPDVLVKNIVQNLAMGPRGVAAHR
eukprot:5609738-Amphidinium_carterae.1